MCGIVGIASRTPVAETDVLVRMRDALRHRGPDDAGVWWSPDHRLGLAHRRLAIIDTSPGGHQPMADTSGAYRIVFNGEIYNYRELRRELEALGHPFRTASDTEVILEAYRAWGTECLSRLNGAFAFCLYDSVGQRLFLARDRAGEKPLFFFHAPGGLVFASELKALIAYPEVAREIDLEALEFYLAYGYVPGEMCILKGVRKLAQAHAMTCGLANGSPNIWRYWTLPEPPVGGETPVGDLTDELETLLEDAVRHQLIADVPVGILLSGGIDSSLVTAMAARASSRPIKTFTITFPGHDRHDEAPYARAVADHFGTQHTEIPAEPATVDCLPDLARQFDEPIADHAIVPTHLISQIIRRDVTVALGGDGGDELFAGYGHYSWLQRQESIRRFIPGVVRRSISRMGARCLPVGARGRNHLIGFGSDIAESIAHVNMYFDDWSRGQLLSPVGGGRRGGRSSPERYKAGLCPIDRTPVRQATEADFRSTMVDGYLVKVDRASMLSSLEIRAPWLDWRLIEFAFGRVPDGLRATGGQRKILSRRLAQRVLPSTLDLTRKQGFTMPLEDWFDGEWGRYIEGVLLDAGPVLFDRRMIRRLIANQRRGLANTPRLFALTMFELWRREYRASLPG